MVSLDFATRLSRQQKRLIFLAIDMVTVPFAIIAALLVSGADYSPSGTTSLSFALMAAAGLLSHQIGLNRIKLNSYEIQ